MLSLDQALSIATATLAEGKSRGCAPLCVAVLDKGGHLLALLRDEHASLGRPHIAIAKASGCLGMGLGGRELARRAQVMPQFFSALATVFPAGIVPIAGGVLLRSAAGDLEGAVGVSGDTSDNDEMRALAGINTSTLVPDTGAASA